jgi:hypothetical protein
MKNKLENRLDKFYNQAWNIVKMLQKPQSEDVSSTNEYMQELNKMYEILKPIGKSQYISVPDISEFYDNLVNDNIQNLQYESLIDSLNNKILIEPYSYNFYFSIGRLYGFMTGFEIGTGSIYQFKDLPKEIKHSFSGLLDGTKKNKNFVMTKGVEDLQKRERFLHIKVESIGSNKAKENALFQLKSIINILKFVYSWQSSYFPEYIYSPFEFCVIDSKYRIPIVNPINKFDIPPPIIRAASFDSKVSELTVIVKKIDRNEIEKRILNALDIFGMIDASTPLHIRFMLCIISLEGLLLGEDNRDYLRWKLAEKVAFLLGDVSEWFEFAYNISDKNTITEDFKKEKLADSRIRLNNEVIKLYDKRSAFAHGGKGKEITFDDYRKACLILRLLVDKLLELRKEGITHLSKKNDKDAGYLDEYIAGVKYS